MDYFDTGEMVESEGRVEIRVNKEKYYSLMRSLQLTTYEMDLLGYVIQNEEGR